MRVLDLIVGGVMRQYETFVSWYLSQLCPHSVDSIVVTGNLMVCMRCQKQMQITDDLIARFREHSKQEGHTITS